MAFKFASLIMTFLHAFQIFVRQAVFAPDIIASGQKIRIASLSFEQSAKHQNMAERSLLFEGKNQCNACPTPSNRFHMTYTPAASWPTAFG